MEFPAHIREQQKCWSIKSVFKPIRNILESYTARFPRFGWVRDDGKQEESPGIYIEVYFTAVMKKNEIWELHTRRWFQQDEYTVNKYLISWWTWDSAVWAKNIFLPSRFAKQISSSTVNGNWNVCYFVGKMINSVFQLNHSERSSLA